MNGWLHGNASASGVLIDADGLYADYVNQLRQSAFATAFVGLTSKAQYPCTGVNDYLVIDAASAALAAAGGGLLALGMGNFNTPGRITNRSNVHIQGRGMDLTTLLGGNTFDYTFYNSAAVSNVEISDLTIDCQNADHASAFALQNATNCTFRRVRFKNVAAGGWMLKLGVPNSASDGINNLDNKFIDCEFDTHAGSLEMLLLFNCENTQIIRPKFLNKTSTGPTVGLWQKCYGTKIIDPVFRDIVGGCLYYSVTVEDTWIVNPYMKNTGGGIAGAQTSDNGNFGLTHAEGLHILNPKMVGGANSLTSTGIQLGSVNNVTVLNPQISGYQIGIAIDKGNNANVDPATNWEIINPKIFDNNSSANVHLLHPGILIRSIGGALYGKITFGEIYGKETTNQRYPIVFDGAFTWDNIEIVGVRLSANTGGGGTSIALGDGAALGSKVVIRDNTDYSGSTPPQASFTIGAQAIPRLTTTQKNALTPVNGMVVYDSTLNKFQGYENGAWTSFI